MASDPKKLVVAVAFVAFMACSLAFVEGQPSYVLVAAVKSPHPAEGGFFGDSVRIGADRFAVTAPRDTVGEVPRAGAAYSFDLSGKPLATLVSSSPKNGACFGGDNWTTNAMTVDGDLVVVGESMATGGGRAYVFDRNGKALVLTCTMEGSNPRRQFGASVAADGGYVVVGGYNSGAWLYDRAGKALVSFIPKNGERYKSYGMAVALRGNLVLVTQDHALVGSLADAGMAFLFDKGGAPIAVLQAPDPEKGAGFGVAGVTDGKLVAIGAPGATNSGKRGSGKIYLYSASGKYLRTLVPPESVPTDGIGVSVAIQGDRIYVGAPGATIKGLPGAGCVFVFDSAGNLLTRINAPTPSENAAFGWAVDARGDLVLIGAYTSSGGGVEEAGEAFLFKVRP